MTYEFEILNNIEDKRKVFSELIVDSEGDLCLKINGNAIAWIDEDGIFSISDSLLCAIRDHDYVFSEGVLNA